jgi:DNA modification methylase
MTWEVVRGDARSLPLADESVDLICTSPPYWSLRSYRDGGEHYQGQVGSETTPAEYVSELVGMIDSEWRRVLKGSGSLFLNMGDKMAGSGGAGTTSGLGATPSAERGSERVFAKGAEMARAKSLLGLPWRVALQLIDRGWILRAEIIWSKPNGLPESVTDRVRRSHEQVFHFVTEPRYYSAVDEIRTPGEVDRLQRSRAVEIAEAAGLTPAHLAAAKAVGVSDVGRGASVQTGAGKNTAEVRRLAAEAKDALGGYFREWLGTPSLGRLPGSVWTIPTSPLIIPDAVREHYGLTDHFAAYPPELVRRIVLGWSPLKVCSVCGEGRRPVVRYSDEYAKRRGPGTDWNKSLCQGEGGYDGSGNRRTDGRAVTAEYVRDGEACACTTPGQPTKPGVVLDPMCGTGTTVGVAHKLGRNAIGVDLSMDYVRLARWRVGESDDFDQTLDRSWSERQLSIGEGT